MAISVNNDRFQNLAFLLLRFIIIAIFLYHGVPKAIFWTAAMEKFVGFGLPGFLGPITGIVEVIASVFLFLGWFWRETNLILLFIIAGAIAMVQLPKYLADSSQVAGLERDLLILIGLLNLLAKAPKKSL